MILKNITTIENLDSKRGAVSYSFKQQMLD